MQRFFGIDDISGIVICHRPMGSSINLYWVNTDADEWGVFGLDLRISGIRLKFRAG